MSPILLLEKIIIRPKLEMVMLYWLDKIGEYIDLNA